MSDKQSAKHAFRSALGAFATGVTITTTMDSNGQPVGVTASSFNSVSLDPPLVLWSLAKDSLSHEAFRTSGHFAVHILAADQMDLSNRFARSGEDKFADVQWSKGDFGSPIFAHHAALFECETRHQYDGGDHVIIVGEVKFFENRNAEPLIFHAGNYAKTKKPSQPADDSGSDIAEKLFSQ